MGPSPEAILLLSTREGARSLSTCQYHRGSLPPRGSADALSPEPSGQECQGSQSREAEEILLEGRFPAQLWTH